MGFKAQSTAKVIAGRLFGVDGCVESGILKLKSWWVMDGGEKGGRNANTSASNSCRLIFL